MPDINETEAATTAAQVWGTRVESEAHGDAAAIRAMVTAAFSAPAEADLVDALRADSAWVPELSWLAYPAAQSAAPSTAPEVSSSEAGSAETSGSEVAVPEAGSAAPVAHALLTRCHIVSPEGQAVAALALAPCSVLPQFQGRGAGSAVIIAALEAARRRLAHSQSQVESAVVVLGHPEYYPRFGFVPASKYRIQLPAALADHAPDEAFRVLNLDETRPLPAGTVRYPAPFGV